MTGTILQMEHISRSFGAVKALHDVTLTARGGSVHALCGENGAGKSTLMKILAGLYAPDEGRILLNGKTVRFRKPADALDAGISMLYQELDLAEDLTVYQNIFLGREILRGWQMDDAAMIRQTAELLAKYGFTMNPEAEIRSLSMGECQIVELMKALLRHASVIVMDEPTSSLSAAESEALFRIIGQLKQEGLIILYISHRMEEIQRLADDISILRDGEIVRTAPAKELDTAEIVRLMVGRELKEFYPPRSATIGETVFEARSLSGSNGVGNVSFSVRRGEILGFAGLVGAGRSETADLIFGTAKKSAGQLFLNGKELTIRSPEDAIRSGIAYLTEDRKRSGLCTGLASSWNLTLPNLSRMGMSRVIRLEEERKICLDYGEKLRIRWNSPDDSADTLSGGNQQKILVARWILAHSEFLIFDEPARGVDVGAKQEIYRILNRLAEEGKAILVISSELPELLGICDRICVFRQGSIRGIMTRNEATPEKIMRLAASTGE